MSTGTIPRGMRAEAEALYERLEQEVIPEFYTRDDKGLPAAWVMRIRESMANLTPRFSASRTVREYTEEHYLPAAAAFRARTAGKGAAAAGLVSRRGALASKWGSLRFGRASVDTREGRHFVEVEVHLGDVGADMVRVELYADGLGGGAAVRQEMTPASGKSGDGGARLYSASVPSARPQTDYTARIIPRCDGLSIPLEAGWILWQK